MPKINDEYDIGKAFQAIEDELIASYIRNLRQHKIDEVDENKQWTMWQVEQLQALEKYKKDNQQKYGKQFKDINAQIEEMIRIARSEGNMEQEKKILEAIKKGFPAKKLSKESTAEFFKLNERKLEALIKATMDDMEKAETAVLRMADDQYRKVIFNAQVYANTGAGTYEKAVDMATKDFLAAGLNCIEYANGARHTLADYADMAIRTASKRAYLQGEGEMRQEWNIFTVIMNKRGNACPKCVPFVGKVLIDDVWSGGPKDGKSPETGIKYPLMSSAIEAGLYHPRCKDVHTTYFEGISTPPDDKYTREELEQLVEQNRQEVKRQYAERQEKKYSRMAEHSLDTNNKENSRRKAEKWKNQAEDLGKTDYENKGVRIRGERNRNPESNALGASRTTRVRDSGNRVRNNKPIIEFDKMSPSELREYATNHLKTEFIDLKGVNDDFLRETVKAIDKFERMNGGTIEGLKIQFGNVRQGAYASFERDKNTIFIKKTGNLEKFNDKQIADNLKFKRKWKTEQDWHAASSYKGMVYHELGHAVDYDTNEKLSRMLSDSKELEVKAVKVSGYAGSPAAYGSPKRSEAWAENFAAFMEGGENATKVPSEISDMIEGYINKSVVKDAGSGIMDLGELFRKNNDARKGFKFISDKMFDDLTISARKKGATILRGTEEIENHLDKMEAAASNLGDVLMFRKDVCVSEVLEETYHFEQNLKKMNADKREPIKSILNEIDAKRYILDNSDKYKIPRNEIELTKRQLESYEKQLKQYEE